MCRYMLRASNGTCYKITTSAVETPLRSLCTWICFSIVFSSGTWDITPIKRLPSCDSFCKVFRAWIRLSLDFCCIFEGAFGFECLDLKDGIFAIRNGFCFGLCERFFVRQSFAQSLFVLFQKPLFEFFQFMQNPVQRYKKKLIYAKNKFLLCPKLA